MRQGCITDEYRNKRHYVNDKRHRTDGPAVESADGYKAWWVGGVELTESQFNEKYKTENKERLLTRIVIALESINATIKTF